MGPCPNSESWCQQKGAKLSHVAAALTLRVVVMVPNVPVVFKLLSSKNANIEHVSAQAGWCWPLLFLLVVLSLPAKWSSLLPWLLRAKDG